MKTLILKKDIKDKIRLEPELRNEVAKAVGRSFFTVPTMLKNDDLIMTSVNVLAVIKKHTGIKKESDLLEPVQAKSAA